MMIPWTQSIKNNFQWSHVGPRRPLESSLGCAHTAPTFCQHCAQAVPALCPLFAHKSRLCPHFAPLFAHAVSTLCLHATHALLIHHCSFVYPFITVDLLAQEVVRTSPPLCWPIHFTPVKCAQEEEPWRNGSSFETGVSCPWQRGKMIF